MKSLYVTSIENFSGKTAVVLGLGRRLQVEGHSVGYLKPVSYEATQYGSQIIDEDVSFVKNVLSLPGDPSDLSAVVVTPETISQYLTTEDLDFSEQIKSKAKAAAADTDLLLIEGGGSLRQGYVLGLSTMYVAEMLDAQVLVVVKFRDRMRILDDALTADFRLQDRLLGMIINRVPEEEQSFVMDQVVPYLERKGISVLGVLPERPNLAALTVQEIIEVLDARVLTGEDSTDKLVEDLMVGAMGAQEALSRFRQHRNKAVITGGDRTDIQLAALETSTACLVLTGNLTPSATVLERAAEAGVPVLLVPTTTMDTIERIEEVFGKTRLGQATKLAHFESLMAENVDFKRLLEKLSV